MIEQMGWEKVIVLLGFITLLIGVFTFLSLRNKVELKKEAALPVLCSLKKLLTYKSLLILAAANLLMAGVLDGFADVWGVQYLMLARDLSKTDAASLTSLIYVGMLFGGPILAFFAEKYNAHYTVTLLSGILMSALIASLLLFNVFLSDVVVMLIIFVAGLLCCYQVIVFAIGHDLVPLGLMPLTIAFLNCVNMYGGTFFHGAIGILMDFIEQGTMLNGVKVYSLETYTYALALIPLSALLGAGLVWWSKSISLRGEAMLGERV